VGAIEIVIEIVPVGAPASVALHVNVNGPWT
jgi:hypothetical protein